MLDASLILVPRHQPRMCCWPASPRRAAARRHARRVSTSLLCAKDLAKNAQQLRGPQPLDELSGESRAGSGTATADKGQLARGYALVRLHAFFLGAARAPQPDLSLAA